LSFDSTWEVIIKLIVYCCVSHSVKSIIRLQKKYPVFFL
jgi:hypothetical protein